MKSPEAVIHEQLNAYNAKDLPRLLNTYAEDAEQTTLNGDLLAKGHQAIAERFITRFSEPDLHARLLSRTIVGNIVVDHECITRNFPEGKGTMELLCIYEVRDGRIHKASFAMGEQCLHAQASPQT
jgi:hypothetical protein